MTNQIMSLKNWLHRHPIFDTGADAESPYPYALSSSIRDPFSDAFSDLVSSMARLDSEFGALRGFDSRKFLANFPAYEVDVTGDKYKLKIDMPGVKADDLSVELEDDGKVVHISGHRKFEKEGVVTESRFEKHFTLRDTVDPSGLTARLEHGVLTLEAPMSKEIQPKKRPIAITEGPSNQGETDLNVLGAKKDSGKGSLLTEM
ncbi:hypothetical protein MPSEU_000057900 [Mayamaea pseudoterrestris]|nr:hypothetical protein MPSEU_000057900 [Mayamaea pseudoterrestris]